MKYKIALKKTDEGYSASVPGLPGCWSQGATEAEVLENNRDAIESYLSVANEQIEGTVHDQLCEPRMGMGVAQSGAGAQAQGARRVDAMDYARRGGCVNHRRGVRTESAAFSGLHPPGAEHRLPVG